MSSNLITFITDFGLNDPYVGMMKGVIYQINPCVNIVDLTHSIPPGAILQGAFLLKESHGYFPKGTIHLAVVDPGVGTPRKALLVETKEFYFLGPDNGLLWPSVVAGGGFRVYSLDRREFFLKDISSTFHGRDIFAPIAGHLSKGMAPEELGTPYEGEPKRLEIPRPIGDPEGLKGIVLWVDRFGNLVTNIALGDIAPLGDMREWIISIGPVVIKGIRSTFGDVGPGEFLCYWGSMGYLEIGVNMGSAAERLTNSLSSALGLDVTVKRTQRGDL